jgi:hypothetical protein
MVIEDVDVSKAINKDYRQKVINDFKIDFFRKDKTWVLAGDK